MKDTRPEARAPKKNRLPKLYTQAPEKKVIYQVWGFGFDVLGSVLGGHRAPPSARKRVALDAPSALPKPPANETHASDMRVTYGREQKRWRGGNPR